MQTSIMNLSGYLFFRWRSVVALLGGILAAMGMLFFALSGQSGAQTTGPVQAIAAGDQHALVIVTAPGYDPGMVYAWGSNYYGQIGDDTRLNNRFPPVRVHGPNDVGYLTGMKAIEGGFGHSLAVKSADGSVWAWGDNGCGTLGNGEDADVISKTPVRSGNISGVTDVAAGFGHSLALTTDGHVYGWGCNSYGQLGVGRGTYYYSPTLVNLTEVKAIAAGMNHSLFLKNDGTVWASGGTNHGQLGIGSSAGTKIYPVQVHGGEQGSQYLTDVKAIAAGKFHSLAVTSDGTVYAWGGNAYGQLGDNSDKKHSTPVTVHGPNNAGVLDLGELTGVQDIATVAAGEHHSLALKSDGTAVYAWGGNNNGQIGIGSTTSEFHTPYQVHGLNNEGTLSGIADVAAGQFFSIALKNDRTAVYAWGGNSYGQIDATGQDHTYPVQVSGSGLAGGPPEVIIKPWVRQVVPADEATDVRRATNVIASFSENMNAETINQDTFTLMKEGTATEVAAKVSYNSATNEATLNPNKPLSKGETYTATVSTEAKNLAGNALEKDKIWSFKVRS